MVSNCCETSPTIGVSGAIFADDVAFGDWLRRLRRRRRMQTILIITMPINAVQPTTPPTITPVLEARPGLGVREGDVEGAESDNVKGDVGGTESDNVKGDGEGTESDNVKGDVEGTESDSVSMVGLGGTIEGVTIRTRNLAKSNGWVPAEEGEVMFPMIFWPGPISGLSKTHRCHGKRPKERRRRVLIPPMVNDLLRSQLPSVWRVRLVRGVG